MWKEFAISSLDMLYPPECYFCQSPQQGGCYLCEDCHQGLLRVEAPYCYTCGEPYDGVISEEFVCPNCAGVEMQFEFARASLRNSSKGRELVHGLKYQRKLYLVERMAELMAEAFWEDERFRERDWLLVPVPLHWLRLMSRQFNQSEKLTEVLAEKLGLPWQNLLVRRNNTGTQTKLGRKKRLKNLLGSFVLKKNILLGKSLNIIVVDDVLTTGSTATHCAVTLKQLPEVEKVVVLTLLRG